jgi:hypothetical protein
MIKNREFSRQVQTLNGLFDKTKDLSDGDIETMSHWAKYLCVLCAGLLENSLVEFFYDFSFRASSPNVANFTRKALSQIHNPNTEKLVEITSSFNKSWGEELQVFIDDKGRKDAINTIMAQRHRIAHGKVSDISFYRLKEYFRKSVEVIEFIEKQCR